MKVSIERINEKVHFVVKNNRGNEVHVDGPEEIGGENKGMRPMELLLGSLATCSVLDVVEILKKQRQELHDIRIEVEGLRPENVVPKPFQEIKLKFFLKGKLNETKVAKAIELGVTKYCSVGETLDPKVKIGFEFEILNVE